MGERYKAEVYISKTNLRKLWKGLRLLDGYFTETFGEPERELTQSGLSREDAKEYQVDIEKDNPKHIVIYFPEE